MLTDNLRTNLIDLMKTNPQEAIKEFQKDPKLFEILLSQNTELNKTKEQLNNDRIKYINMTSAMQNNLKEQAEKLKTTQGLLIGVGLLWFLNRLSDDE